MKPNRCFTTHMRLIERQKPYLRKIPGRWGVAEQIEEEMRCLQYNEKPICKGSGNCTSILVIQ